MQNAGGHASIKYPGQTAPTVAGYGNEVSTFAFCSVYDCFHNRALNHTCSGLDTLLAEFSFKTSQVNIYLLCLPLEFFLVPFHVIAL